MEDENESSSESGIRVDGIVESVKSPHKINKKAYDLKLIKNKQNNIIMSLDWVLTCTSCRKENTPFV